jgi:uncharacterized membrane-anchored protein
MKKLPILIFVLVALAQLSVPAVMAWNRVQTLAHGRVWKFKTAPIDPEDAVRGRYVRLSYDVDRFTGNEKFPSGDTIYAVLKENAEGFAEVDRLTNKSGSGDNFVKVESWWGSDRQNIAFPFNQYWVTERDAPAAEKAYAENSRRGQQNAFVTVRVRNGDAALEQLYIDNQPLRDYLRAQAQKAQSEKK